MLGIWADQYGGRVVYTLTMLSAAVMTSAAFPRLRLHDFPSGRARRRIAGGSFSVGIAYVRNGIRWRSRARRSAYSRR